MKITKVLLVVWILLSKYYLSAQSSADTIEATPYPCLQNSDFANAPGPFYYTNDPCQYWNTGGVQNWTRSHGTPSISIFPSHPIDNYVYLWGATPNTVFTGEGIFAGFTCSANTSYTARIRVHVTDPANSGNFLLYCANGLSQPPIYGCGSSIPQLPPSQLYLITSNTERNAGWKTYEYVFTPTSTFNQIWIFPYTPAPSQYTLLVDYVKVCRTECLNTAIYNTGQLPTGLTTRGYIFIGSSAGTGGSGTVTVSATGETAMTAANEITIVPEFNATVTTGFFNARIQPCDDGSSFSGRTLVNYPGEGTGIGLTPRRISDSINSNKQAGNLLLEDKESVEIYPNPSTGRFIINTAGMNNETINIGVYDYSGQLLLQRKENLYGIKYFSLDLSRYKPGCYFIKITGQRVTKTLKAFILR